MNWYCVHTKPQKEIQFEQHCRQRLDVETYCPQVREYRTVRRVRRVMVSMLFPRYVFCRFDPATSYRGIRYAPDAVDIVRIGSDPIVVADSMIADVKQWAGHMMDLTTIRRPLMSGDSVEITQGPLRGLTAVIQHAEESQERVAILIELLTSEARITISRSNLRAMHAA